MRFPEIIWDNRQERFLIVLEGVMEHNFQVQKSEEIGHFLAMQLPG